MQLYIELLSHRHSDEMIEKLESAGLGFYVRATETQQKLGKCANASGEGWPIERFSYYREDPPATAGVPCVGPTPEHATSGIRLWATDHRDRKRLHQADCV